MAVSLPAYESVNEFDAALAREIDEFLVQASVTMRSSITSTTSASNPITAMSTSNNFGIVAAGGAQRNFQITVSVTENDASDTPNSGVITA